MNEQTNQVKKSTEGYALAAVMLIFSVAMVLGTAGFSIAMQDDRKIYQEAREIHAFWAAESGVQHIRAMTLGVQDDMGDAGLPQVGDTLTWTNDTAVTTVEIEQISGGYLAGYHMPTYQLTSVGTAGDSTRTISQKVYHSSYGFYGVVLANDNVFFTGADTISGDMHVNGYIKMSTGWGLPTFWGTSYSTKSAVQIDYRNYVYPDGTKTVSAGGSQVEVFKDGAYFNREPIDFSTKYVNSTLAHFENVSKTDSGGVYLEGDYHISFKNKKITCTKGRLSSDYVTVNRRSVDQKQWISDGSAAQNYNTKNKSTIYVTGDCYVSGTLKGDVSIVSPNDVIIDHDGITYKSAPKNNKPVLTWTDKQLSKISDSLGIIAGDDIITYATDTIQIHGVLLALEGGLYPANRGKDLRTGSEKPKLTVFGTVAEKVMEYTEGSMSAGFGVDWHGDERFKEITPPNYPRLDYKYYDWEAS